MEHMFHIHLKDKIFGEDCLKSFATEILDAMNKNTFKGRQQSTLDQQLTSTEQSYET
jgi:hypothetical protein